jgi:oligopeptide/dipeptide ABC transporter ATP-binding protein
MNDPRSTSSYTAGTSDALLEVRGLYVDFRSLRGEVKALIGVDLEVGRGEIVGLVGESGCGKTVTGLAVLGLLREPQAQVRAERIRFAELDLLHLPEKKLQHIRGARISVVFQDPLASLNPVFTVGDMLVDVVRKPASVGKKAARAQALEALRAVGLGAHQSILDSYPHQLSGGMRQRACIAMALACGAELLFADEPTTALDVTIQAQILHLLLELRTQRDLSIVLVTHNMGIAAQSCDRVAVMYAGMVVEQGATTDVLDNPRHPYTAALRRCLPEDKRAAELESIPGSVPDLIDPPPGCRFHPRCSLAVDVCTTERPVAVEVAPGHLVACHRWQDVTPDCCTVTADAVDAGEDG